MRTSLIAILTVMSIAFAGTALADPGGNGNGNAYGLYKDHGDGQQFRGAPGPIAGVGLPILLAAGAYTWVRRRREKAKTDKSGPSA